MEADGYRELGREALAELVGRLDLAGMDDAAFASLLPAAGWDPAATGSPAMAAINNLPNCWSRENES